MNFLEARLYARGGGDHIQVGMTLPSTTNIIPITYKYLKPYYWYHRAWLKLQNNISYSQITVPEFCFIPYIYLDIEIVIICVCN